MSRGCRSPRPDPRARDTMPTKVAKASIDDTRYRAHGVPHRRGIGPGAPPHGGTPGKAGRQRGALSGRRLCEPPRCPLADGPYPQIRWSRRGIALGQGRAWACGRGRVGVRHHAPRPPITLNPMHIPCTPKSTTLWWTEARLRAFLQPLWPCPSTATGADKCGGCTRDVLGEVEGGFGWDPPLLPGSPYGPCRRRAKHFEA